MRLFYPGAIQFSDKEYEPSKGARLATDMRMYKFPDNILYENSTSRLSMTEEAGKHIIIESSD